MSEKIINVLFLHICKKNKWFCRRENSLPTGTTEYVYVSCAKYMTENISNPKSYHLRTIRSLEA